MLAKLKATLDSPEVWRILSISQGLAAIINVLLHHRVYAIAEAVMCATSAYFWYRKRGQ